MEKFPSLRTAARYFAFCAILVALRGFGLASMIGARYPFRSFITDTFAIFALMGVCHAVYFAFGKAVAGIGVKRELYRRLLNITFVLIVAFPFLVAAIQLHPQKLLPRISPAKFNIPFESVEFRASDGALRGWLLNPEGKNPPLLMLHGLNASKDNFLPISAQFAVSDFPVLTFDFRAHGESDGRLTTFGLREKDDVSSAVEWIRKRYPNRPMVAIGYSLGGSALLQYCAGACPFDKIVVDATFATLKDATTDKLFSYAGPLKGPIFSILTFWGWIWSGVDVGALDNRAAISRIEPQKILLIHGTKDSMIAASQSKLLQEASGGKIQLWEIEGANHLQTVSHPEYFKRVVSFLLAPVETSTQQ